MLPFWITAQDLLTRIVMNIGWYRALQNFIVPYELHVIAGLLHLFGFPIKVGQAYIQWQGASGNKEVIYLAWNCIGWQTALLLLLTLFAGLSGKHTFSSKLEMLAVGILGTYLVNIIRLTLVILVYILTGRTFGTIFHDYFSNIFTLLWLIFYWWFSFTYILEEK